MPNGVESGDIDVEEIGDISIGTCMLTNAKFCCDRYVFGEQGGDSNTGDLYEYLYNYSDVQPITWSHKNK